MRFLLAISLLVAWTISGLADVSRYRIKSGDRVEVLVWQEEGLQRQLVVAPDGMISFPFVGHIRAKGRTASELERTLRTELTAYITDPIVTVSYLGSPEDEEVLYEGYLYVTGQVGSPGLHKFDRPTNVLQALSQAGGLSAFAAKRRIKIIRKINKQDATIVFDYVDVSKGRDMTTNIRLKSGDVIVVPERSLFGGLFE